MSEEEHITGQQQLALEKPEVMGVASVCSKRRLESGETSQQDSPAIKIAKKNHPAFAEPPYPHTSESAGHETSSSEFLTTSILARTLLTGSSSITTTSANTSTTETLVHVPPATSVTSPLDSLKSSLEGMPAPIFLESLQELRFPSPTSKQTIEDSAVELEFTNLLCHETSLATVTILSPIDEDVTEWRRGSLGSASLKGLKAHVAASSTPGDSVITEDENGKSYFNLGPSDATVLAKKHSGASSNFGGAEQGWMNGGCNNNGNGDIDLMDDTSSSSSCDSISSEDLFNSCEEFDASDDEEEVRTYKQERSTVLHLSLCKLNMFRTHCLEPSLHRSVLICNTLRHIEQEIRSEDEAKDGNPLQTREVLPPFWPTSNAARNNPLPRIVETLPVPDMAPQQQQQPHDPYLSSNSTAYSSSDSPYSSYDYNSLRPSQTPFHAASYDDYSESELSLGVVGVVSPSLSELVSSSTPPTLLDSCDSGYGEEMELSSYYYSTPPEFSAVETASTGYCGQEGGRTTQIGVTISCGSGGSEPNVTSACRSSSGDMGDINCNSTIGLVVGVAGGVLELERIQSSSPVREPVGTSDTNNATATHCWPGGNEMATPAPIHQYAQQEGQCGLESMRSDYGGGGYQQMAMDSLVSNTYSSSLS